MAGGLPQAERSHARIIGALAGSRGVGGETLARIEGRHRGFGGNALRAAVLGANDGLVSNLSLVMGVSGAALSGRAVLITGIAGLLAGACSMALGEWLSVNSSRESYQRQIDQEASELAEVPEEEEELVLIYQAKGLSEEQARALADRLMADKDTALDTLVREELGIDPTELGGSAWVAATTSFCLFAFGALFPVLPFIVTNGIPALVASVVLSGLALFVIGVATSLFTGRGVSSPDRVRPARGIARRSRDLRSGPAHRRLDRRLNRRRWRKTTAVTRRQQSGHVGPVRSAHGRHGLDGERDAGGARAARRRDAQSRERRQ